MNDTDGVGLGDPDGLKAAIERAGMPEDVRELQTCIFKLVNVLRKQREEHPGLKPFPHLDGVFAPPRMPEPNDLHVVGPAFIIRWDGITHITAVGQARLLIDNEIRP